MQLLAVGKWWNAEKQWRTVVALHRPVSTSGTPLPRPERRKVQLQRVGKNPER